MIKITRLFMINLACVPLFLVAYFTKSLHTLLFAYCTATVHELFHLFAALILSIKIKSIIIMPFGITLRLSDAQIKSPIKEIALALAGPFANLVMIALSKIMESIGLWSGVNLFLFVYLKRKWFPLNKLSSFKMYLSGKEVLILNILNYRTYCHALVQRT